MTDTFVVTLIIPSAAIYPRKPATALILTPTGYTEFRDIGTGSQVPRMLYPQIDYATDLVKRMYPARANKIHGSMCVYLRGGTLGQVVVVEIDCEPLHQFRPYEPIEGVPHALDECYNWGDNTRGDCGGRVELVNDLLICENCRNR